MLLSAQWTDTSSNVVVHDVASNLMKDLKDIARRMGMLQHFIYLNYANEAQNPIASYGKGNRETLRNVGRVYDPSGVFQRQVPGGFKLFS
jgi:hypothetical protein